VHIHVFKQCHLYVCVFGCTTHGAVIGSTCECSVVQAQAHFFHFCLLPQNLTHLHVRQEHSTKMCIMSSLFDSHWHSVNYLCDAVNHGFVRTDTPLATCVSEIHYTVFSFVSIPEIKIYTGLPHGSTDNQVAIVGGESH